MVFPLLNPKPHHQRSTPQFRIALLLLASLVAAYIIWLDQFAARHSESRELVVSLDTNADHFRNRLVRRFSEYLEVDSGGKLSLQLYESGQLMSDRDVPKALALGVIDFAVPADSKIARFDPNAALLSLPAFYGRPAAQVYEIADGPVGAAVRTSVENSLNVRVLEPVIDLGFTATFSTSKALASPHDYKDMKIRIPGGTGPAKLFELLGAIPIAVPFPDVPLALSQGNLDAIQTTHETARSAKLWDSGLTYCLEDNANLIQYYPMISQQAAGRLSSEQMTLLRNAWHRAAADARAQSIRFQSRARQTLAENGIKCRDVNSSEVQDLQATLQRHTRELADHIAMNPGIVDAALAQLEVRKQ